MVSFHQYEELCSIFDRMDRSLPNNNNADPGCAGGWTCQHPAVVEARPSSLSYLALRTDTWRFKGHIPLEHRKYQHRHWYIRESTRLATDTVTDTEVPPTRGLKLPPGTSLWHAPEQAKRLIALAKHDATLLFEDQLCALTLPASNGWHADGFLTLFSTPGPGQLLLGDCTRLLRPRAPYVARLVDEYVKSLSWMYDITPSQMAITCRLHITWYPPGGGSPMQLTESSANSHDNGPVVHVGVGEKIITHDLSPTLPDHSEHNAPVRLCVPEGVMVCLDGATRMRYSHGHPTRATRSHWLSLTFFMDCVEQSVPVAYEEHTRIVVTQTPIHPERIVSTTPRPELPLKNTRPSPISSLIVRMRARLRTAESLALAGR